jgi:hypothetical protein
MRLPQRIAVDPEIMMGKTVCERNSDSGLCALAKNGSGRGRGRALASLSSMSKADLIAVWEYAAVVTRQQ